ncbi:MAG TPA: TlpA family protein disulfide reductase [Candidatus Marinimicrobia bacterium]|nr:TlpA family protein disulfide reductase [Candidatus Neomarinimicrobiota bacterium]
MGFFRKKSWERELAEIGGIAAIFAVLWLFGWHTEVIGRMQQLLLSSGIIQPKITAAENAPDFSYQLRVKNDKGEILSGEDLANKVLFINLWASWCPPCVAEMPDIERLYRKVSSDKILFIMLNIDKNREAAERFLARKSFDFPVWFPASLMPVELSSRSIPVTFVISPEGKIVVKREGMAKYNTQRFRNFLKKLAEAD